MLRQPSALKALSGSQRLSQNLVERDRDLQQVAHIPLCLRAGGSCLIVRSPNFGDINATTRILNGKGSLCTYFKRISVEPQETFHVSTHSPFPIQIKLISILYQ